MSTDPYGFSAGYYDLFRLAPGARPSIAFFAGAAPEGARALEIGPGTGRITLAVAERASEVYGVERSATMRAVLLAKLAQRPDLRHRVTVLPGTGQRLDLGRRFGYAYLAGVLEHVPHAERGALFAALARHLEPGGLLAVDMVLDYPVPDFPERLIGTAEIGACRYELTCAIRPTGPMTAHLRYVYRTYLHGELIAEEPTERPHMMHRRSGVLADLAAAGLEPVGGGVLDAPATEPGDRADHGALIARKEPT